MDSMVTASAITKAVKHFYTTVLNMPRAINNIIHQREQHNFFNLPPEIRLIIYKLHFADTSFPVLRTQQRSSRSIYAHPLMNASSRLRMDAAYPYIFLQLDMIRELKREEQHCWEKVHGFEKKHGRIRGAKVGEYRAIWESASAKTAERKRFASRVLEGVRVSKQMGGFGGWDVAEIEDWLYGESWREYRHGAEEVEIFGREGGRGPL